MGHKGILLAGGSGTRLWPATQAVSKQLIPIFDKPMIYYPLSTLILSGVRDILVVTSAEAKPLYQNLLGDGSQWGIKLSYQIQPKPQGIAQAILLGEDFIDGQSFALVLGDNLLYGSGVGRNLKELFVQNGAHVLAFRVANPQDFGVISFNSNGLPAYIREKPNDFHSDWAIPGLYFYDSSAVQRAKGLQPSERGELEITDLNNLYIKDEKLFVTKLSRGTTWLDLGTPKGMLDASHFVQVVQERQGILIGSPEEAALRMGFVDENFLLQQLESQKSDYARNVRALVLYPNRYDQP